MTLFCKQNSFASALELLVGSSLIHVSNTLESVEGLARGEARERREGTRGHWRGERRRERERRAR